MGTRGRAGTGGRATAASPTTPISRDRIVARATGERARIVAPTECDGARGQVTRKFDYTHLGNVGAEVTAKLVTEALAREVPALRSQLVR